MDEEWIVDEILKMRLRKDKFVNSVVTEEEFLVKWSGYSDEYNNWVTLTELYDFGVIDAEEIIQKFKATYISEKNKKKREREKVKKQNKPEPEKWASGMKSARESAALEEKRQTEITNEERKKIQQSSLIDQQERFKFELEQARIAQEILSEKLQAELLAQLEKDSDSDSDWEWEEIDSQLEETLPKLPKTKNKESDRMKNLRVVRRNVKKRIYVCNEDPSRLREAIVCVLGHVDAGKTTLLDTLRNSSVQKGEAGGITQQIGATHIPIDHIKEQTEELNRKFNVSLKLPGFLFIDTPGHESFSNMRVRGTSLCDIAVIVVDILQGLQSQAKESLRLLKRGGTRFVIALNKVDKLHMWKAFPRRCFKDSLQDQIPETQEHFKKQLQMVRDQLMEQGIIATAYWNSKDLDVQVPIIPMCGLDGCGIPDLMMFTMLYAQCVLTMQLTKTEKLECAVFEVHEAQGLGQTIDVLLINGELKVGDKIILCGLQGSISTVVRGIFIAKELQELKGQGNVDTQVQSVTGVRGVKLWARGLDQVVGGSYLYVMGPNDNETILSLQVMSQLEELKTRVSISKNGLHVQASTLGSLEALLDFLNENGVSVGSYGLGEVSVKDVKRVLHRDRLSKTIIAFDVVISKGARHYANVNHIEIISGNIIYQLLDLFKRRLQSFLSSNPQKQMACVLEIAPAYIIHPFTPLVIGVHILIGNVSIGTRLYLIDQTFIGEVESMQNISTRCAVNQGSEGGIYILKLSAPLGHSRNVVYGRDFFEDDMLYTKVEPSRLDYMASSYKNNQFKEKIFQKYKSFLGLPKNNNNDNNNNNNNRST